MKNPGKKLFALLLCVMLCCSLMPVYARTEKQDQPTEYPWNFPVFKLNSNGTDQDAANAAAPVVTVHGSDCQLRQIICGYNKTVKLTVDASGGTGTLKYQWYDVKQENFNTETGEITFKSSDAISGATKRNYTTPAITTEMSMSSSSAFPKVYGCVVTDQAGKTGNAIFAVFSFTNYYDPDPVSYGNGVSLLLLGISINNGYVYYDISDSGESSGGSQYSGEPVFVLPTKYEVYRKEKGGSWKSLKTLKGPGPADIPLEEFNPQPYITDFVDKTAKMGVTYLYKYRSYLNGKYTKFCPA